MRQKYFRAVSLLLALLLPVGCLMCLPVTTDAAPTVVYLGDRQDLVTDRDSLDGLGMNTAHSGEALTVGTATFEKGVGFHCQPDRDAFVEFNISGLGLDYFAASVGVLQYANYFMEWGSISFHVYGDGKLLASSHTIEWGDEPFFLTCSVKGVKTLRLVQKNEGSHSCDAGIWGDARLTSVEPTQVPVETVFDPDKTSDPHPSDAIEGDYAYISNLYWLDSATYPGNEIGRDCNTVHEMIFSADGTYFPKGIGLHATSDGYTSYVDVNIDGLGYTKFASYYGVCETLSGNDITMASIRVAVFGDGQKLFESEPMAFGEPMKPMECDVTGVKILRIAVAGAPGIAGSWGTFGGAVLSKSGNMIDELLLGTGEPETTVPETVTETSTEPVSEPTSDTAEESLPVTAIPTEETTLAEPAVTTDNAVPEPAPKPGCASAVLSSLALTATAAAVLVLRKRKED